jgi:murein DD-endopeptidase MepM/ murein hydrolase activator NlpD
MTFINRNQIILLLSFIFLLGISYFLSISFGENLVREKKVSKKIITDEDPIHIEEKLEIDFTLVQKYYLQEGETFTGALKQADLQDDEINDVVNIISKKIDLRKLNVGTLIETYTKSVNDKKIINEIIIYPDIEKKIYVKKVNNKFVAGEDKKKLFSKLKLYEVEIHNSIYESLKKIDTPDEIIMEFVQLYSFDIDFQRDIRKGNKIKIFFEIYTDSQNNYIKSGNINFSEIILDDESYELYRFQSEGDEFVEYFNSDGKSATKALMKTPINGARLSSGFGMRKHPILGYNKKHQGVDFAAPTGTPIMAAGTGHIEFVGNNGGAGKYIRIKHLNGYKTSYSHLSKYASGIQKNVKVRQGQVIGYVGNTGLSTGPHLHYEVIFNGKRINPMKMKLPSGKQLKDKNLEIFLAEKERINAEVSELYSMN